MSRKSNSKQDYQLRFEYYKGHFRWPDLMVKESVQSKDAGFGLFAVTELMKGDMIPYFGRRLDKKKHAKLAKENKDAYVCQQTKHLFYDADPNIMMHNRVGGNGLFIAALVNEATLGPINCELIDHNDQLCLRVLETIEPGQELTTYYGDECERNYTVWSGGKPKDKKLETIVIKK